MNVYKVLRYTHYGQGVYNSVMVIKLHTQMCGRSQKHCSLHERAMKGYLVTEDREISSSVGFSRLGQTLWRRKHTARPLRAGENFYK